MGSEASISFYKSGKDESITCTKLNNEHTHPLSEAIYKHDNLKLTKDEMDLCANLNSGNCKPSQIKRVLYEKFNKEITIQKLKNIVKKLPVDDDDEVDFEDFFTSLDAEGAMWTGWMILTAK